MHCIALPSGLLALRGGVTPQELPRLETALAHSQRGIQNFCETAGDGAGDEHEGI
jgi:hypothetical protein